MKKIFSILIIFLTFSTVSMEEQWIFLRKTNLPDKETADWQIKSGQLELNVKAEDPILLETFTNLILQKKDTPYILIGLRDIYSFYHFLDGSYLPLLVNTGTNPSTQEPLNTIEIFVAGKDEILTFLHETDLPTIQNNFLTLQNSKWQLKEELEKPGYGHLAIADLFIHKAKNPNISLSYMQYQSQKELNEHYNNIDQVVWQYAYQWLTWALQYLPPGKEFEQAKQERDKISAVLSQQKVISHELVLNDIPQKTWEIKKSFQVSDYIRNAIYNSTAHQLCILTNKDTILVDVDDQKLPFTLPHTSGLWKPSFDPSGRYIATSTNEKTVVISDTDGNQITTITPINKYHEIVSFGKNHPILIAGGKNVELRNLDGTLITNHSLEKKYRIKIAKFFPHNEDLIFLSSYSYRMAAHKAKIWDIRNKNLITYNHIHPLKQASLHPEGNYIACTKQEPDGVAHVYDLRNNVNVFLANLNQPRSAKFNSSGTHILTNYYNAYLALLWKTEQCSNICKIAGYAKSSKEFNPINLSSATFHPDGNSILTCSTKNTFNSENNISLWDLEGNQLAKLPHAKTIYSAKYDKTGNYIISRHEDNIVTLWEKSE